MRFLLDTCLVSELVKKEPNPKVVSWLDGRDEQSLFLSVLTIGELQKGVSKLPAGIKKEDLQVWIEHDLAERFEGRILELDMDTALTWGKLQGEAEQRGEKLRYSEWEKLASSFLNELSSQNEIVPNGKNCWKVNFSFENPVTSIVSTSSEV